MGKTKLTSPPIFQSKLLCRSLIYMSSTIFLALHNSLKPTKCLFRSSPLEPIRFSYPSSYGQHKYAIPTHRSTCSSPVYFNGVKAKSAEPDSCSSRATIRANSYGLRSLPLEIL